MKKLHMPDGLDIIFEALVLHQGGKTWGLSGERRGENGAKQCKIWNGRHCCD